MTNRSYVKCAGVVLIAAFVFMGVTNALAADKNDHIKVGFIYDSPVDGVGWSHLQDLGRKYLEKKLGDRVTTFYAASIPEAGSQRVIRRMVAAGADLLFTTSFGYMNPAFQVATAHPNVIFMNCTGYKRRANMGLYMARFYQARYLAGMVAGAMTNTNKLGFVAGQPIPQVIRAIDAYTLGARAVNPKAKVSVIWINAWYDPTKARAAANTLIAQGIDVITYHTNSPAVIQAAAEHDVYSIGYSTLSDYGGKYQLTSVVPHWGPFFVEMAKRVLNGTWQSNKYLPGLKIGAIGLTPFSSVVPARIRERVNKAKQAIIDGKLNVFAGPIVARSGKVTVPKGEVMPKKGILKLDYYVKGIVTPLPTN